MGALVSKATRHARRFNAENRAQRVIEQDRPTVAPTFEANKRDLQKVLDENPNWVQEQGRRHVALDDHLKRVYVTSTEAEAVPLVRPGADTTEAPAATAPRPLPLDRKPNGDFEYGYKEPERVSRGRATLRQALHFVGEHQRDPATWTAARIADEYRLKESLVADILHNFHSFEIYIPDVSKKSESMLISKTANRKQLDAGQKQTALESLRSESYDDMEQRLTGGERKKRM